MAEYISREAAIKDFERCNLVNPKWTPERVKQLLCRQQEEYVERHGRWICIRKGYEEYECSICHGMDSNCSDYYADHVVTEQDYCPFCGAKMDLEQFGKDELFQESKGENENE